MPAAVTRAPDATRRRILDAAFREFYRHGFQGGSLNRIVDAAGITKGALFHHFAGGKQALGYAVVDEVVRPLLETRWIDPLDGAVDPLAVVQDAFRRHVRTDVASGSWLQGCPLNNLAQEMSPLDEGFRSRIDALYARWRAALARALAQGVARGTVRAGVDPDAVAALVVAGQTGIWGTGKYSRDEALVHRAADAMCDWLATLRP